MYSVIKVNTNKDINEEGAILGHVKDFKNYATAAKFACKKNEMVSYKSCGIEFLIWNQETQNLTNPEIRKAA